MNQKEITIGIQTRGIMVYAEPRKENEYAQPWLVLVSHTTNGRIKGSFNLRSHVSYGMNDGTLYISRGTGNWGDISDYHIYQPTEEQKKQLFKIIRENGYRYIPVLNKLVKVTE